MVKRTTKLEVDITATDKASSVVREVAADVETLEGEHTIDLDVDDDATDELADVRRKLDDLTDEDRVIALRATASGLEGEIKRAERSLGRLDKYDNDEIEIRIEARDRASRKLDAVQAELRALDGEEATVRVDAAGADDLRSAFEDLTGGAFAGGAAASLGRGGLIGGAVLGTGQLVTETSRAAIQAQALASATGSTVEDASALLAVFQDSGFDANDLFDVILQVNGALQNSPELAEELGITLGEGAEGGAQQFLTVVENLNTEVDDTGRRGELAAQLFGEEGVRQVAMIQAVVGDLQVAVDDVAAARIISADDVARAQELERNIRELRGHWEAIKRTAGSALIPEVNRSLRGESRGDQVLANTAIGTALDWLDGAFGGGSSSGVTATGSRRITPDEMSLFDGGRVTIINPPGTPAATVDRTRLYDDRNGPR